MLQPHTIWSDDEVESERDDESQEDEVSISKNNTSIAKKKRMKLSKGKMAEFHFDFDDDEAVPYITSRPKNLYNEDENDNEENDSRVNQSVNDNVRSMPRATERAQRAQEKIQLKGKRKIETEEEVEDETEKASKFFETIMDSSSSNEQQITMFTQLNLSRPLLRAIEASGYITPTPIQAKVIPLALAGKDVCASAVTGSGKTAAFMLPILERLLYRPRDISAIRVLVVTPTRELAQQIHEVLTKLARYTDTTSCLISGGKKDVKSQEAMLRQGPDIVICTPGRFIDHMRNSQGVSIEEVDVLVLDEVDRLLDLGFQDEVEELLKYCPSSRQTLLFSATMTPKVEDLAKLSLRRPIRVKTEASTTTVAPRLVQEFVKVKDTHHESEATVLALIVRAFHTRTIVFFETKKQTHRFYVLLSIIGNGTISLPGGLVCSLRVAELHGDMTQTSRYLALEDFKAGKVDVLVCTDVAARGLDIPGIRTVINSEMPRNASTYIHRVGRTARAGCGGRAVTLVSDDRRKIMKDVLKGEGSQLSADGGSVLSRSVPADIVHAYQEMVTGLESAIVEFLESERANRKLDEAMREADKAENLIRHQEEIKSRPARTWYQTETQKREIAVASKAKADTEKLEAKLGKVELLRRQLEQDDFRVAEDEKKQAMKLHRMSRAKRRRLEALRDDNEQEDSDSEQQTKKQVSVKTIAKRSKAAKRSQKHQDARSEGPGIGEADLKKSLLINEVGATKVIRQRFAAGGLDNDVLGWGGASEGGGGGKKAKVRMMREVEEFRGFDPTKQGGKRKKLSSGSFKTKKRFKRR